MAVGVAYHTSLCVTTQQIVRTGQTRKQLCVVIYMHKGGCTRKAANISYNLFPQFQLIVLVLALLITYVTLGGAYHMKTFVMEHHIVRTSQMRML